MPQVKDMSLPVSSVIENTLDMLFYRFAVAKQYCWIQVPLHRPVVTDGFPSLIKFDPPVNSNHACPTFGKQRQQCRIASCEIDDGNTPE